MGRPSEYDASGKGNDGAMVLKAHVSFGVAYVLCIYLIPYSHQLS